MRNRPRLLLALLVCALPAVASAQTTYRWKSSGTNWGTAGNWEVLSGTDTAPPNSNTATAIFNGFGAAPGTTVSNPSLAADFQLLSLLLAPNQQGGGWTFSRDSTERTITLGGSGSFGIRSYGPATYTFTGIDLAGSNNTTGTEFFLNATSGSTVVFDGSTKATSNLTTASIHLRGGTLVLDNSTTSVATRISTTPENPILMRSGTLHLIGGSSTTTYDVGSIGGSTTAGVNTIRVTPTGTAVPTLRFANSGSGFSTRFSQFNVLRFEAGTGELGTSARITFAGSPNLGANGLLAAGSGAGTFGYAIAKDSGGIDFATWGSTNGIVRAGATETRTTRSTITSTDNTSRVFYNPTANDSSSTALTVGSLRITPGSSGLSLSMGTNNLVTNALMLNGGNDYAISGTGDFGATGPRYIHVNESSSTLTTSLKVVNGTNSTVFAGPGFMELNGTAVQVVGSTSTNGSNRLDLIGGILRATNTNFGFDVVVSSPTSGGGNDSYAALNFRGGVLEISGGSNGGVSSGDGSNADFKRVLGTVDGTLRWEGGGGGFSAYGSDASVNIGGNASPSSLRWGQSNFVEDGYALKFGSTKSDATLTFLNPLQLDQASNQPAYSLREVNVVRGTTTAQLASKTTFTGVVSGASTADLIKTGNGVLEFTANNSYSGNTLIHGGELRVTGQTGTNSGTGTGNVIVMNGGMLSGTGRALPGSGKQITIRSGGYNQLRGSTPADLNSA